MRSSLAKLSWFGKLCFLRRVMAVLVLLTYLFAGAAHELFDLDVATPSGSGVVSLAEKGIGHPDQGGAAENHCHGCFSVSIEAATSVLPVDIVLVRTRSYHDIERRSLPRGIDPPPPKFLT